MKTIYFQLCTVLIVLLFCGAHLKAQTVQSGTTTLSGSSTTQAITPVVLDRAILTFSVTVSSGAASEGANATFVQGTLQNNQISFERNDNSGTVTIQWFVTQFGENDGVFVQRGQISASSGTTHNATLPTAIDLSKSFPIFSYRGNQSNYDNYNFFRAEFTSTSNLQFIRGSSTGTHNISWQAVQYQNAQVQTGTTTFSGGGSNTANVAGLNTFDPGKSWLIFSYNTTSGGDEPDKRMLTGALNGTSGLTFQRDRNDCNITLRYYLVEFTDDTEVQSANASFSSGATSSNPTIATVDLSKSIVTSGYTGFFGRINTGGDEEDSARRGFFRLSFNSATQLNIVRNQNGHSANIVWFVVEFGAAADPCASLTLAEGDVIQPQCFGGSDGSISVVVTGGTPDYSFSWENNASIDSTRSGLQAGSYKIYVEDDAGCIDSLTIILGQPSQVVITLDELIDETCPNAANGSIEITASNSTGNFTYAWSHDINETDDNVANLTAGFYTVTATDGNGCTAEETFEVQTANQNPVVTCPNPDMISLCFGEVIDLDTFGFSPSGGTYFINGFSNGSIFNSAAENTGINNIWYVYSDQNTGCVDSCLFIIFVGLNPGVTASSNTPVCEGNTIELTTIASGGTGTLTFAWEGPDNYTSTEANPSFTANANSFGDYIVTVTDENGCFAKDTVTVDEQFLNCCPNPGTTFYVSPIGDGDGLTEADPTSLDYAMGLANSCGGEVAEIVFSADTFIIDESCGLDVPPNIILTGAAGGGTVLSGNFTNRIFNIENAEDVLIRNIRFINGFATGECFLLNNGGAIAMGSFGTLGTNNVIIRNCSFVNNEAVGMGGHIYNAGNSVTTLTIENTTFSGGISGSSGGAISNEAENDDATANLNLINCRFIGNEADEFGGAIYNNALGDDSRANLYMVNNLLHNNEAAVGGAVAQLARGTQSGVTAELINCTVADNNSSTSGGAFYNQTLFGTFATLYVINGIVWDNTSLVGSMLRTIGGSTTNVFEYSLLQSADCADAAVSNDGASVTCDGTNLFNVNPEFRNAAGGDYTLLLTSPAINVGNDAAILATGVTTDLAGQARILEGTVDMGAFENISMIPTMSEWGLIILALLMLQGIWFTLVFKPTNVLRDIPAMWIQGLRVGLQDKNLLLVLGMTAVSVLSVIAFFGIAQAADIVGVPMALFIAIPAIYWYKKLQTVSTRSIR